MTDSTIFGPVFTWITLRPDGSVGTKKGPSLPRMEEYRASVIVRVDKDGNAVVVKNKLGPTGPAATILGWRLEL